jgi:hypothetical protein
MKPKEKEIITFIFYFFAAIILTIMTVDRFTMGSWKEGLAGCLLVALCISVIVDFISESRKK